MTQPPDPGADLTASGPLGLGGPLHQSARKISSGLSSEIFVRPHSPMLICSSSRMIWHTRAILSPASRERNGSQIQRAGSRGDLTRPAGFIQVNTSPLRERLPPPRPPARDITCQIRTRHAALFGWWAGGLVFGLGPLVVYWFVVLPLKGFGVGGGFPPRDGADRGRLSHGFRHRHGDRPPLRPRPRPTERHALRRQGS
jgi:hypothetical protein